MVALKVVYISFFRVKIYPQKFYTQKKRKIQVWTLWKLWWWLLAKLLNHHLEPQGQPFSKMDVSIGWWTKSFCRKWLEITKDPSIYKWLALGFQAPSFPLVKIIPSKLTVSFGQDQVSKAGETACLSLLSNLRFTANEGKSDTKWWWNSCWFTGFESVKQSSSKTNPNYIPRKKLT